MAHYTESEGAGVFGRIVDGIIRLFCWIVRTREHIRTGKDPLRDQIETAKRIILKHLSEGGVQEKIDRLLQETNGIGELARLDAWQELADEKKIIHDGARWTVAPEEKRV